MLQISQKTFLLGGLAALLLASAVLFTLHDRALDPIQSGTWWAVRFVDPNDSTSLTFEIENHSGLPTGSYEVFIDGTHQESQSFDLASDGITRFTPKATTPPGGRVKIVVKLAFDWEEQEKSLTR